MLPVQRGQSLDTLDPVFRFEVDRLHVRIEDLGLPFMVWETSRSSAAQLRAVKRGFSRAQPEDAPHVHGFAEDLVLTREFAREQGVFQGEYPNLWHTGLNHHREKITHEPIYRVWRGLGDLIHREFPRLLWGGTFGFRNDKLFGWDVPHVELRGWKAVLAERALAGPCE